MTSLTSRLPALLISLVVLHYVPALAQQTAPTFQLLVTFDYPGSSLTIPHGINQRGDVAGEFSDISGAHGFVRYHNGTFGPPLTDPNDPAGETFAFDLNRRAVLGIYVDLNTFFTHSFLLVNGSYNDIDLPGTVSTTAIGLNSSSDYCGSFDDGSGAMQAFVNIAGEVTDFVVPGATFTSANAINDRGSVAGVYQLGDANNHGFIRDASGNLTFPIDYPGAANTILRGINGNGWIAGGYVDSALVQHGFVFRPPHGFASYTYPDAIFTTFEGINDHNQICGQYKDAAGRRHGFILQVF